MDWKSVLTALSPHPLYLPDEELRWMSAMWAGETEEEVSHEESVAQEGEDEENTKGIKNTSKKSVKKTAVKKQPEELKQSPKIVK